MKDLPTARFVTLVYLILDAETATAKIANAGHPYPLYMSESGIIELRTKEGFPLGLMESAYSEIELQLQSGDRVLLYTDGILEATNRKGEEFGISRLGESLRKPTASARSVLADVQGFVQGATLADDATAVALRH
jgi:sigma-B regulation protein RsbU (phosphoserine phosphatase)